MRRSAASGLQTSQPACGANRRGETSEKKSVECLLELDNCQSDFTVVVEQFRLACPGESTRCDRGAFEITCQDGMP